MTAENEVVERRGLQRTMSMVGECDKVRQRAYRYEVLQQLATLSLFGVPPPTPSLYCAVPCSLDVQDQKHRAQMRYPSSQ
ncbi:hypothetical protein M404DRAFT_1004232 [Pisolithus tinctorius Marx 270]|uniref:Uncharacterized protein n=1 Tax=Pisolithus tinctorius Marx 270 TaxID=870435 RepID=A0A0C3NXQ6_PISTI|nr:hypothetical protein M404DRAFT_1004232 [Pisolithus tinctorius Marx 270]